LNKIEFIIRPSKFEEVKGALARYGIHGMTVTHVTGCGLQQGITKVYRGSVYQVDLLPKVKVELVIPAKNTDEVVNIIIRTAKTGEIGDGKIFIYPVEDVVRIRTGERGETAI